MKLNDLVAEPYIPTVVHEAARAQERKSDPDFSKKPFVEYLHESMRRIKNGKIHD